MDIEAIKVSDTALKHSYEVASGGRFEFGKNWSAFLTYLTDERVENAERSLRDMLEVENLSGVSFLDIGSGSGLFSLAARRLGAKVFSFDFDTDSVNCTRELKRRYFENDESWIVEQGSILDVDYVQDLDKFDIVYSWGVLHHTGQMWTALENAADLVSDGGKLFIAIYNDTGSQAARWKWIKQKYCQLPRVLKTPFALVVTAPEEIKHLARSVVTGKPSAYFRYWKEYRNARGMNRWHDIIDWVGGHPYEFAGPTAIFNFYRDRGFTLGGIRCDNVGLGCNEFVFIKNGRKAA